MVSVYILYTYSLIFLWKILSVHLLYDDDGSMWNQVWLIFITFIMREENFFYVKPEINIWFSSELVLTTKSSTNWARKKILFAEFSGFIIHRFIMSEWKEKWFHIRFSFKRQYLNFICLPIPNKLLRTLVSFRYPEFENICITNCGKWLK